MKKILKFTLFCILALIMISFSFLLYLSISTKNITFNAELLTKNYQNVEYYDTNDKLCTVTNGKSEICTEIPEHVKKAFISVEDKRFYSHKGIDIKRIIGASLINLKNTSFSQGASTISQQLIKNTHLSNKKTLKRKFAEIKLTLELEKKYSKDEILNMYLNNIYFGENCYGIKNASEKYFDKTPSELTVAEGALLAGIIKAPSKLNPITNYQQSLKRKDLVLNLMKQNGLSNDEYNKAYAQEIIIKKQDKSLNNSYFYQVEKELKEILNTPYFNSNIKVYTYFNPYLQEQLNNITLDINTDKAYTIINNQSMGIEAYYSTCNEIKRAPGSTIKPLLVYGPNIEEKNVNLYTKILDEETDFNGYKPKNYNDKYYGYISFIESLSKSLNIPSVKLLNSLGEEKVKKYAKKMNINLKNEGLALALGALDEGITLNHLSSCYSTFANKGNYENAKFIKEIKDENGKTIYKRKQNKTKIFSAETSYLVNYALINCVKEGTAKKISGFDYEICAKTGTNGTKAGNIDAYTISYTNDYTVGVWLGNQDNKLMDNKITGGNYPCLITKHIFEKIYTNYKPNPFSIPNGITKVKIDKQLYEKDYELKLANENQEYFEALFVSGTEPTEFSKNEINQVLPNIKSYKLSCNKRDISLFYDYGFCDGISLYEKKNELKLIKKIYENQFSFSSDYGKHTYIIVPFKEIEGKTIFGEQIVLPEIYIEKEIPKEWWRE